MLNIIISFLTFVLIIVSLFMVLVILMQRASANAGMGSAFGGGVAESTFGAETTNILTRATKWSAWAFFLLALVLYLLYMWREAEAAKMGPADLPDLPAAAEETGMGAPQPDMPMTLDESAAAQAAAREAAEADATGSGDGANGESPAEDPEENPVTNNPAP